MGSAPVFYTTASGAANFEHRDWMAILVALIAANPADAEEEISFLKRTGWTVIVRASGMSGPLTIGFEVVRRFLII